MGLVESLCSECGIARVHERGGVDVCDSCLAAKMRDWSKPTAPICESCGGSGVMQMGSSSPTGYSQEWTETCWKCGGQGIVLPAEPSKSNPQVSVSDAMGCLLGVASLAIFGFLVYWLQLP